MPGILGQRAVSALSGVLRGESRLLPHLCKTSSARETPSVAAKRANAPNAFGPTDRETSS